MKRPYSFGVFRYVHDAVTREFVNIGVAVCSPEAGYFRVRCTSDSARIARTFEAIDAGAFRGLMGHIEERLNASSVTAAKLGLESGVAAVLPPDDSAIQFACAGAGLSEDLNQTLQQLFSRYVGQYARRAS
jgi:hypothetical protein